MNVLVVLIPVSVLLGFVGLVACIWTLRADQYEDLEGDAVRILLTDDDAPPDDSRDTEEPETTSKNEG
ncbi:cytochrome oxidase maturation protein, cbb3-type [Jannaschia seosinensis]|uniref:Cytochrome oxidase maturation protein, cbb3-type n=1 Tax=Jannaschia seosinensis TaxID=313367 RepID=A0A0M7B5Q2_9RHOB|nr:cbb3-type cytochrome oxidase assembly protein CcoS [Jannaschia seosinensis]CUH12735.1 cytochrome oxidase maturation protein, cbb3-type [Jannaschia seosinensis]